MKPWLTAQPKTMDEAEEMIAHLRLDLAIAKHALKESKAMNDRLNPLCRKLEMSVHKWFNEARRLAE